EGVAEAFAFGLPNSLLESGQAEDKQGPAAGPRARSAMSETVRVQYLGGPTAILEIAGLRLLTDPTFDPPGDQPIGERVLTQADGPALGPDELGRIDTVLLSHDQHPDNLDRLGREYVSRGRWCCRPGPPNSGSAIRCEPCRTGSARSSTGRTAAPCN